MLKINGRYYEVLLQKQCLLAACVAVLLTAEPVSASAGGGGMCRVSATQHNNLDNEKRGKAVGYTQPCFNHACNVGYLKTFRADLQAMVV